MKIISLSPLFTACLTQSSTFSHTHGQLASEEGWHITCEHNDFFAFLVTDDRKALLASEYGPITFCNN